MEVITACDLMKKEIPVPLMIVGEILPAGLTIFAGKPKIGKSWFALNLAVAVASGEPFLGREADAGEALYLALEDTWGRLQNRVRKILGKAGNAPDTLSLATTCSPLDKGGDRDIENWLKKSDRPRLVVVDVLQKVRGEDKKARAYENDYEALKPLKMVSDRYGVSVLAVTHTRKLEGGGDRFDLVSATTGLVGAADHAMILDRGEEGLSLYGRGRDVNEFCLALSFDGERGTFSDAGDPEDRARSESRRRILDALMAAGKPLGPSDLAKVSGISAGIVRQHLTRMVKDGEVERIGRGNYIALGRYGGA